MVARSQLSQAAAVVMPHVCMKEVANVRKDLENDSAFWWAGVACDDSSIDTFHFCGRNRSSDDVDKGGLVPPCVEKCSRRGPRASYINVGEKSSNVMPRDPSS